jgi:hypothetical protein
MRSMEKGFIMDVLSYCGKFCKELGHVDVSLDIPVRASMLVYPTSTRNDTPEEATMVAFQKGEEMVIYERCTIASLSLPFHIMLNGSINESNLEVTNLSENDISAASMRCIVNCWFWAMCDLNRPVG